MDKIDSSVEVEKMIDSVETEADLSDKSVDRAIWTRLERGMSKSQVRAILGEPQSTQHSIFETWYYTARQDNSSPHVTFDGDRLVNWNEPDSHEYTAAKSKNAVDGVNNPAKSLPTPASGTIKQYHASDSVAPLTIRTRGLGQNYFVKLTEWTTGRIVATVFIRGGQSVDFKMPLGSYKMKYAAGATWYGESELFGPDTSYSEADSRFDFEDNGNQFSGYTVELYLQQNGNLETRKISPSEF
jgi:outer membrane protein assembly factor BamE (lipoprotein component of BamABCDE complex)